MKYGKILHSYGEQIQLLAGYNLGDGIQTLALECLYNDMGVEQQSIGQVRFDELYTYSGDYTVLPIYSCAVGLGFAPSLPFSAKILPLFISTHFGGHQLDDRSVEYLRINAPIGCRDEYSLQYMHRLGIPAYISGCITVLFPERGPAPKAKTTFLVDIPDELENYLPSSIKKDGVRLSHLIPFEKKRPGGVEAAKKYYEASKQILERYKNEASLVVTSRLHAAVPCMAMGIPVIFAMDNISQRFSWVDRYLPLYTPDCFDRIDWNPEPVRFENEKAKIKELFAERFEFVYNMNRRMCEVSEYYETRTKSLYSNRYYTIVRSLIGNVPEDFEFIVWGCGLIGNSTLDAIETVFPNARFVAAIDSFKEGSFRGVEIRKKEEISQYPNAIVFLANYSGKQEGYDTMRALGRIEGKDFLFLGTSSG